MGWIDAGGNYSRFIGGFYGTPCKLLAKLKNDHRPMLTIHLYSVVIWVKLPWRHSDGRHGRTIGRRWGACGSLRSMFWVAEWGDRIKHKGNETL